MLRRLKEIGTRPCQSANRYSSVSFFRPEVQARRGSTKKPLDPHHHPIPKAIFIILFLGLGLMGISFLYYELF